jgi:hypothetical protein
MDKAASRVAALLSRRGLMEPRSAIDATTTLSKPVRPRMKEDVG